MPTEKSCGAVVFRRAKEGIKYLLLHYEAKHWDFPKGNFEEGEKEQQTAQREIREETGLEDAEFADGFREEINYYYKNGDETIHKWVIFLLAETGTEEIKLSFEHIGFAWVSFEHALKKLTYENSRVVLKKANEYIKKFT